MLQLPARVTRYIDANPVDIELDIPILGQFKIYIFVPNICPSTRILGALCGHIESAFSNTTLSANRSYEKHPRGSSASDEFQQHQRYTTVSEVFSLALVTKSSTSDFEIEQLPEMLQKSRWTLYLDNCQSPGCTERWFGDLEEDMVGIAIVRPDGYIGAIDKWESARVDTAGEWLSAYFSSFMI
jgi:hypothetical protein